MDEELKEGAWRKDAECLNLDPDIFYPHFKQYDHVHNAIVAQPALEICKNCRVREDCLEFALAIQEKQGIWGGMTPAQRQRARRQRALGKHQDSGKQDYVREKIS